MTDKQSFDWQAIWRELEWDDATHYEEVMRERLRQRAQQYATPLKTADEDLAKALTVLAFDLGGEKYAVDVILVRAIRDKLNITPVPSTPPFYKGVVNIRGNITTVIDLRLFFDVAPNNDQDPDELVIVRANNLEMALLAHHIHGVTNIPRSRIEPMAEIKYTRGITADGLVLLDIATMFEDERLIVGGTAGMDE